MIILYITFILTLYLMPESMPCELQNLNKLAYFLQTNVYCRDLNLDEERLICKVDDKADWTSMTCSMMSSRQPCELPVGFDSCPDGSYNMTCLPIEGVSGVYYRCGCHVVIEEGATSTGEWTEWQESTNGELYQRKFYEGDVYTCITEIYRKLR